jgi:hypothetical protein
MLKQNNIDCLIKILDTIKGTRKATDKVKVAQKGIKILLTMNRLA